jgi:hypothetical protein
MNTLYRRWSSKAALVVDALGTIAGTDPAPDTGKEEQGIPRPPEAAVEDGQVRFDDNAPN